jgi:D-3-phosphoglycerate dehydrogenase
MYIRSSPRSQASILITDRVHPLLPEGLENLGYTVHYAPELTLAQIHTLMPELTGIIINSRVKMRRPWIEEGTCLRFIGRLGSGLEIIDRDAAAEHGIEVFSAPEGNANAVAEHALGMLLALAHHLLHADREVRHFHWNREAHRGWELAGKTVGILGMGHTGKAFARKLAGMDVHILAYDKYDSGWQTLFPLIKPVGPERLRDASDVLSIHLPLSEETHHLINRDWLSTSHKGQILINTSRGNHVDTLALLEALQTGQLAGACLDVFENEQPSSMTADERVRYRQLYALPQVVLTPHVAGWTRESLEGIARVLLAKIKDWTQERGPGA